MQGADVDSRPVRLEKVDRNKPFKPRTDRGPSNPPSKPKSTPLAPSHSKKVGVPKKPQKEKQQNNKKTNALQNPFANLDEE